MRICSLLPGATEVVAALGLADEVVGVSHECDYPPAMRHKPVLVTPAIDAEQASSGEIDRQVRETLAAGNRLYALDERRFAQAQPDLVITQDLCQVCAVTPDQLGRALQQLPKQPRLLTLNPTSLADVIADVERIGSAAGPKDKGAAFAASLRARLQAIRERVAASTHKPTVVCLEWFDPLYLGGHWVPEMVDWAGGKDLLGTGGAPSGIVTWEQVRTARPDVLIMMPCGFSVARAQRELAAINPRARWAGWESLPAVQQNRVFLVDAAAYFSRPGPRLLDGVAILAALLHPELFPDHERPTQAQAQRWARPA
ncbi:MAG: cobalamin-binding protein [Nitrospirota bacterium]|nr:cobalamin-binding protein [Nitrospirota bacterium]